MLRRNRPGPSKARLSRPGKALTASAARADQSEGALLRLDQGWQREVMGFYRSIGECWNPAQYYSRAMERIRFYPAVRDEKGVPQESSDSTLLDLFTRIQSPSAAAGDLSEIAGSYGRLQFLIGDGLLTVSDDDGTEVWEYLSPMELRLNPRPGGRDRQEYRRLRAPGATPEELEEAPDNDFEPLDGDEARVWRLWRRHPEYSQWADSPVRAVRELFAVLQRLTLAVGAEASSRAAQRGLLFIPEELSFGSAEPTQDENPEEDPILREFVTAYSRAIANPGSAEAMMPFIMRAAGVTQTSTGGIPTADLIKWMALGPSDRYTEGEMWDKVIARIAGSLDLPKEMLTGIEDVSHWSAWFLDEIGFRQHTGPTVVRFCNDLASSYLRPAALEAGVKNAENVTVWFDASQAINHPDETGVYRDAHDRLVISDEAYRTKIGASEADKPDETELERRVAIKLKEFPSDMEPHIAADQTPPTPGPPSGQPDQKGPPPGTTERPPGNKPPSPNASLNAMVLGAAFMAVDRARELAGARLVRRSQSCGDCKEQIENVPKELVAATLGAETVRDVIAGHSTEADLVDGIGEQFAARLRAWDVNGGWPEQLGVLVEQHALRTLYETEVPPLPPGFMASVARAIAS